MKKIKSNVLEKASVADFKFKDFYTAFFLSVVVGIVPLLVMLAKVPVTANEIEMLGTNSFYEDVFSYYKSWTTVFCAFLLLCYYGFHFYDKRQVINWKDNVKNPVVIASAVFILMAVASSLFSQFGDVVIHGVAQRYESIFVLLSYMIIFFSAYDFVQGKFQSKVLLIGVLFSCIIIGTIGLFQFFHMDFFTTKMAAQLVYGQYYSEGRYLTPKFTDIYSTLYNPNCVGLYSAMLLPITLLTGIFSPRKSPLKYILLIAAALMGVCLVGSKAAGGFFGFSSAVLIGVVVGMVYVIKFRNRYQKQAFVKIGIFVVLAVAMLFVPPVKQKINDMVDKLLNFSSESPYFFTDLIVEGSRVEIVFKEGSIGITFNKEESKLVVTSSDGTPILVDRMAADSQNPEIKVAYYKLPALGEFNIRTMGNAISFEGAGTMFNFAILDGENMIVLDQASFPVDLHAPVPSIGFEGMELFASSRGYIWSRSFPLIKDTIFLGKGADAFSLVFPQNDVIGKTKYFGNPYLSLDKPHNFYIQTAVNTGVVSLVALLVILAIYFVTSLKTILTCYDEDKYVFGLKFGIMMGICGYAVAALTTDSTVSVSPVFWAVLGIGFAINAYSRKFKIVEKTQKESM